MKINKINLSVCFVLILFLSMGCDDNPTNPDPESSSVSGIITFTNLNSLPATGSIAVSLSSNWIPEGAPKAADIITDFSNDTYAYSFTNLSFDTYAAIAVSWENPDEDYNISCNQTIIGAYGGAYPWLEAISQGGTDPTPITTSTTNYELTGYDINVNLEYAIPNPIYACQPPCATLMSLDSWENQGHCEWDVACNTKN